MATFRVRVRIRVRDRVRPSALLVLQPPVILLMSSLLELSSSNEKTQNLSVAKTPVALLQQEAMLKGTFLLFVCYLRCW